MFFFFLTFFFQTFNGTVFDTNSDPVEGVKIYSAQKIVLSETSAKGRFSFKTTESSVFPVQFIKQGYTILTLREDQFTAHIKIYLEPEKAFIGNEVVVQAQANRLKQAMNSTPIVTSHVTVPHTGKASIKQQFTNLSEILMQESSASGGSPIYKGFRANKLLFTVNGIRFNNAFFKSGNTPYLSLMNPIYFTNTMISDGANALLYGSDGIGGAINISAEDVHEFGFTSTVFSGFQSASLQKYLGMKVAYKAENQTHSVGTYYGDAGKLRSGKNGNSILAVDYPRDQQSAYKQVNIDYDGEFKFEHSLIDFGFHYGKQYDADDFFRIHHKSSTFFQYQPLEWGMLNAGYTYLFSNDLHLKTTLYVQRFQEKKKEERKQKKSIYDDVLFVQGINSTMYQTFNHKTLLSYGFDAVYEHSDTRATTDGNVRLSKYPDGATQSQFGLFVSGAHRYNSTWNFSGGLRYSYQNTKIPLQEELDKNVAGLSAYAHKFNSLSGSVSADYKTTQLHSTLLIGTAFRAPNFDDLGKSGEQKDGFLHVPNYLLEAEKSVNLQLKNTISFHYGLLHLDVYTSFLNDVIQSKTTQFNGLDSLALSDGSVVQFQHNANIQAARIYGFNIGISHSMNTLTFEHRLSYVRGEEASGTPLSKIPPLRLVGNYQYQLNAFQIYSVLTYSSKQSRLSDEEALGDDPRIIASGTPSYFKCDIGTRVTFNPYFAVNIHLENITDELYRNHASALNGVGRSVQVDLEFTF